LWQQRKRAADLLSVAARYGSFPIILETYREVLRDIFDLPALIDILRKIRSRTLKVTTIESRTPSPFAASLLFNYVANYIYEGDAPLAERRAQALAVDQSQLRELIGEAELRDLLDTTAIESVEAELQLLPEKFHAKSADAIHDLLLRLGDLTRDEIAARAIPGLVAAAIPTLLAARRVVEVGVAGEPRVIAVENVARYRDALGTPLPAGLPAALLEPASDPLGDLIKRYARTHGPFASTDIAIRFGLPLGPLEATLARLTASGRLVEGAFRPGGRGREWCDADVLRTIRRRSLARLRQEVEPVEAPVLGRFLTQWHGIGKRRGGLDTLLDIVEQLQGVPLVASLLEHEILPSRVVDYLPAQLDTLLGAGEVSWLGVEPLGDRDGRIALYLTDHMPRLLPPAVPPAELSAVERDVLEQLRGSGASFFAPLHLALGGGFPKEIVDALWSLVWKGLVTNDTLHALRAFLRPPERARRPGRASTFRSRRLVPPAAEGRWAAVPPAAQSTTEWAATFSQQLLTRHGVVTREVTSIENVPGGFSAIYPVMRRLEETGRVRRGYFVAGLGAAQFAQPGAIDLLRAARELTDDPYVVTLAATDPANPYGALLAWPAWAGDGTTVTRAARSAGARVVMIDGHLAAWIGRGDRTMLISLPTDEPDRARMGRALAQEIVALAHRAPEASRGWLIEEINGTPAAKDPAAAFLLEAGFAVTALGLQFRVARGVRPRLATRPVTEDADVTT
jgi:ATP-dependent Lhr-like helicase